jgi:hypothetical protein
VQVAATLNCNQSINQSINYYKTALLTAGTSHSKHELQSINHHRTALLTAGTGHSNHELQSINQSSQVHVTGNMN